jgi:hypothetical protein
VDPKPDPQHDFAEAPAMVATQSTERYSIEIQFRFSPAS